MLIDYNSKLLHEMKQLNKYWLIWLKIKNLIRDLFDEDEQLVELEHEMNRTLW
jgi:hypothetical protein